MREASRASISSTDSGNRCKKAPPINAPAAKATKISTILFRNFSSLKKRVIMPTNESKLTIIVLNIIQSKTLKYNQLERKNPKILNKFFYDF